MPGFSVESGNFLRKVARNLYQSFRIFSLEALHDRFRCFENTEILGVAWFLAHNAL